MTLLKFVPFWVLIICQRHYSKMCHRLNRQLEPYRHDRYLSHRPDRWLALMLKQQWQKAYLHLQQVKVVIENRQQCAQWGNHYLAGNQALFGEPPGMIVVETRRWLLVILLMLLSFQADSSANSPVEKRVGTVWEHYAGH